MLDSVASVFRSKNRAQIRGVITAAPQEHKDGILFTVTTYDRHRDKAFITEHLCWGGPRVKSSLMQSQIGDMVDIEGTISRDKHIVILDIMNYSMAQRTF